MRAACRVGDMPYNGRMETIAIIGGGAAGLAAAAAAARVASAGAEVVVLEADERVGRSILATGNGRCNFSNAHVDAGVYRNVPFVAAALDALRNAVAPALGFAAGSGFDPDLAAGSGSACDSSPDPVHAFFADLGLVWREEGEGRLYPLANKASSVLDVLRLELARRGVRVVCNRKAVRIDAPARPGGCYHVRFADGSIVHARACVVATGGQTARGLVAASRPVAHGFAPMGGQVAGESAVADDPTARGPVPADGQTAHGSGFAAADERTAPAPAPGSLPYCDLRPVLGPLRTDPTWTKPLNNIRVRCVATLAAPDGTRKAAEVGEVLFRDYGVSGIAVFNLSRFAEVGDVLLLDLAPHVDACACESMLQARWERLFTPAADPRTAADPPAAGLRVGGRRLCAASPAEPVATGPAAGRSQGLSASPGVTAEGGHAGGRVGMSASEQLFAGMLLPAVARAVCKQAGVRVEDGFSRDGVCALARALKGFRLEVRGVGDARQCQVTRGGFSVEAFSPETMEARILPGLHVVGEALDVDAPCGGYNLHWAWASGLLAGAAAAAFASARAAVGAGSGETVETACGDVGRTAGTACKQVTSGVDGAAHAASGGRKARR